MSADGTALAVYRYARKVADVLIGAGQLVEQRGFAAVLVSGKRKGQRRSLGNRMFIGFYVIFAAFTETRMRGGIRDGLGRSGFLCRLSRHRLNFNFFGICQTQGQLVAVDAKLHRVAHRCKFYQGDLCAGNDTHVQEVLTQGAFATDGCYNRRAADGQFF